MPMPIENTDKLTLFAIAPTLFTDTAATVDGASMADAAERLVLRGIRDFLLTGAYGEFQSLNDDERIDVLKAIAAVPRHGQLMSCAASNSTAATLRLGTRLLEAGANLIMVAPPLAAEVTSADVIRHFEVIARSLGRCVVVYNNPVFGRDLSVDELREIAAIEGIVGVKQGTPSITRFADSLTAVKDASMGRVQVLAASDVTACITLTAGAAGLTSTNSWIFPEAIRDIVSLIGSGRYGEALTIGTALDPYFTLVRKQGQPRAVKAAMQIRGYPCQDAVRLPYVPIDSSERAALASVLADCDARLDQVGVGVSSATATVA
jgi:4-hydroxy-tetrahydrodipicolinate synthase